MSRTDQIHWINREKLSSLSRLGLVLVFIQIFTLPLFSSLSSSSSFQLKQGQMTGGGGNLASTNYRMTQSFIKFSPLSKSSSSDFTAKALKTDGLTVSNQSFSIAENSSSSTEVGTLSASASSGTLEYTLNSSSVPFVLNPSTGVLTVSGDLDYESQTSYTLDLSVSDGTSSVSFTATVTVTNVNEIPQFVGLDQTEFTLELDQVFSLDFNGSDPENDTLSFSSTNLPDWLSLNSSTGVLSGTPGSSESGARYAISVTLSDGSLGTTSFINLIVSQKEADIATQLVTIRVLNDQSQAVEGAKVQLRGDKQVLFTNNQGEVVFKVSDALDQILVSINSDDYLGKEESFILSTLTDSTKVFVLSGNTVTISGQITSVDGNVPLATVSAYSDGLGRFSVETDFEGRYTLNIPQPNGSTTWSFGASKEGLLASVITLNVNSTTPISQDLFLTKGSLLSWSSFEVNGQEDQRLIKIETEPPFQSGDENFATVQFFNSVNVDNSGTIGSTLLFSSNSKTVDLIYTRGSGENTANLLFTATPTGGSLASTVVRLEFSDNAKEVIPIVSSHFIDRVRGGSGDLSSEQIQSNGTSITDFAGFEVPPFGVSPNVDVIRIKRKSEEVVIPGITPQGQVYDIQAISIDNNVETVLGSGNINEILLTFPYDANTWSPAKNGKIYFSEDNGSTWQEHDISNIVYLDTLKSTVTFKSTHLSLWTLATDSGGLFGSSGTGSGSGGGCFLAP